MPSPRRLTELFVLVVSLAAATTGRAAIPDIAVNEWAKGFDHPVAIAQPDDRSPRFFVVDQPGRIRVIGEDGGTGSEVVLDIHERVNYGGEKGLLGLTFHPDFRKNGRLFVNYTTGKDDKELKTHISEFKMAADGHRIDAAGERVILEFAQPHANHNGGNVLFGRDGFLYIGNGDGGSGNDPHGNGQKLDTLLGKFLRIDVDRKSDGLEYAIPKDNPFADRKDVRGEVWAIGLRNPWRWSFDRTTGELWAGDVGQGQYEEIDLIEKGKNYGWRIMEGFHCTPGIGNSNCDQTGLTLSVAEYPRKDGDKFLGNSVTGGYVYRGKNIPALQGVYIYGDFGSKRIWGLRYENGKVSEQREIGLCLQSISSFGEDREGEQFVIGHGGTIYRIGKK